METQYFTTLAVITLVALLFIANWYRNKMEEYRNELQERKKDDQKEVFLSKVLNQQGVVRLEDIHAEIHIPNSQLQKMNNSEKVSFIKTELCFEIGKHLATDFQIPFEEYTGQGPNEGMKKYKTKITLVNP